MSMAPSAGNVHTPSALDGFAIGPFKAELLNERQVLIRGVDLVDEGAAKRLGLEKDGFDILLANTARAEKAGMHVLVTPGHTPQVDPAKMSADEMVKREMDQPVVGFVRNVREGRIDDGRLILGDVVMDRTFFEEHVAKNKLPRRSIEVPMDEMRISNLALLGPTLQDRPIRDMLFSRAQPVARFSKEWRINPMDSKNKDTTVEDRIEKLEKSAEQLGKRVEDAVGLIEKFAKPKDDRNDNDPKDPPKDEPKSEPADEQEGDDLIQRYEKVAHRLEKLEDTNKKLLEANKMLQTKAIRSDVEREIMRLSRRGVLLPQGDELKELKAHLESLDEDGRKKQIAMMEKHWARVPTDPIDRSDVVSDFDVDPNDPALGNPPLSSSLQRFQKRDAAAEKLVKESNGQLSRWEAMRMVAID